MDGRHLDKMINRLQKQLISLEAISSKWFSTAPDESACFGGDLPSCEQCQLLWIRLQQPTGNARPDSAFAKAAPAL
jgi:hypothetical protein